MERIKRITSYSGHARFLASLDRFGIGTIPRQKEIPSPYAYSPDHQVHVWKMNQVIIVETAHKQYDVFSVPAGIRIQPTEKLDISET